MAETRGFEPPKPFRGLTSLAVNHTTLSIRECFEGIKIKNGSFLMRFIISKAKSKPYIFCFKLASWLG